MQKNKKLNSLAIQKAGEPGRYHDGGGLYLQVSNSGTKSWELRFTLNTKPRYMGLGSLELVSLSEARSLALGCRRMILIGTDPIEHRNALRTKSEAERSKAISFDECAKAYINSHRAKWKNAKHADQWENTIATYASPLIGNLPIQAIDTNLVMKILEPIWHSKTETASRLRNRIELVLSWASARGYRTGENPARWRGHLDKLLPKRSEVQKTVHYAALPISQLGSFMESLRKQQGIAPKALELLILTATRTSEVLGAEWEEFNLDEGIWTIPASRMKAKKEHRVPLSKPAVQLLNDIPRLEGSSYVFSGRKEGAQLSNMALLVILKRMGLKITAHGFRSTFRDWASEHTTFSSEVAEAALAHTIKDKVEAAYRRGDLLTKRQKLMEEWARFCSQNSKQEGKLLHLASSAAEARKTLPG